MSSLFPLVLSASHISAGSERRCGYSCRRYYFIELLTLEELTHLMYSDRSDPFR